MRERGRGRQKEQKEKRKKVQEAKNSHVIHFPIHHGTLQLMCSSAHCPARVCMPYCCTLAYMLVLQAASLVCDNVPACMYVPPHAPHHSQPSRSHLARNHDYEACHKTDVRPCSHQPIAGAEGKDICSPCHAAPVTDCSLSRTASSSHRYHGPFAARHQRRKSVRQTSQQRPNQSRSFHDWIALVSASLRGPVSAETIRTEPILHVRQDARQGRIRPGIPSP